MDLVKILSEQYMKKELPEMNVGDIEGLHEYTGNQTQRPKADRV